MSARGLVVLALVTTMTAATAAQAAPPDDRERASERFHAAQAAFARREYARAAVRFEEAARLVPHPTTWLNAAEARELGGDLAQAADDCDRALADASAAAETVTEARRRLGRLLAKVATLSIVSASGATIRVDGDEAADVAPHVRRLSPGSHVLARTDRGSPEPSVRVVLVAGETTTFDADQALFVAQPSSPTPSPEPPAPAPATVTTSAGRNRIPSLIGFGAAGALALVAGGFGLAAAGAKSDYDASPSRARLDDFERDKFVTNVFVGWAVAAVVGAAVLWWLAPTRIEARRVGAR